MIAASSQASDAIVGPRGHPCRFIVTRPSRLTGNSWMRYVGDPTAKLRAMNVPRRLALTAIAAIAAVSLLAGPTFADEPAQVASVDLAVEDEPAGDDDDHRISLVDTPRNRFKLLMVGVLFVGGGIALVNARRQMKGERDQATGDFRWR